MRKIIGGLLLLITSLSLKGQYNSIGFGVGTAGFRGETSNDNARDLQELGQSAYAYYNYWLRDSRWQYSVKLSYHKILSNIEVRDFLRSNTLYQARSHHFNLGVGMRFYLDNKLSRYRPRSGQWAVFGAAYAGLETFYSDLHYNNLGDSPSQSIDTDFNLSPYLSGEIGVRVFMNPEWYSEVSGGLKYGFNDYWDGISGHTGVPDFLYYIHLGLGYAF